jgi:Flp pilus assembly protein TadG
MVCGAKIVPHHQGEGNQVAPIQPQSSPSRRRRRGRSSGQSLVEFALIAPVFFVMFFGIVEFAFILTTLSGYNFAAREGARFGSIVGRTDANADQDILTAIINRSQALPFGAPLSVDIYKSLPDGNCVGGAVGTASCTENQYQCTSKTTCSTQTLSNWPVDSRNDTLLGADYLGVRVLFQYTFVTSFLNYYCSPPSSCPTGSAGTHLNLSATSVQRIEPQDYGGGDVPSHAPTAAGISPWLTAAAWMRAPLTWWAEGAAA